MGVHFYQDGVFLDGVHTDVFRRIQPRREDASGKRMDGGGGSCPVVHIHIVGGEAEWDPEVVLVIVGILVAVVGEGWSACDQQVY